MRRKEERIEINQSILIEDIISGTPFGSLVNISTSGIMIMTGRALETHAIFQLALKLPTPVNNSKQIVIGADCLWSRQEAGQHWAGLQIIDASEEAIAQIKILMQNFSK